MNRFILALAGLLLAAMPAAAQTSPGWTAGQVPTAAQWNATFAGKADVTALTAEIARATSAEAAITAAAPGLAPVQSVAGQTGAVTNLSMGQTLATGSTTARTLAARAADIVNVFDYGATGNGTTDDTTAIQAAATACPASGCTLLIPAGRTYLVSSAILLHSHTTVSLYGATLSAASGMTGPFLENINNTATVLTDSDIRIYGGTLDYSTSGAGAGSHAIQLQFVDGVTVQDVLFRLRGAGDAVAGIGVAHAFIRGNSAYDATNAPYDFWWTPIDVHVIGNFATTLTTSQMVNFNPEPTSGGSTGFVADGFVLVGNSFECTGSSACPILASPLGAGTYVKNVTISDNNLKNVSIVVRGATTGATISGNTISNTVGGGRAIGSYTINGGTPDSIQIVGNTIINPDTSSGNYAVIQTNGTNTQVIGNTISGSNFYAGINASSGSSVIGNQIAAGLHSYRVTGSGWTSGNNIEGVALGDVTPITSATISGKATITGTVSSPAYVSTGTVPTLSGTCSTGTQVGGATAGKFAFSAACSGGTVIMTFANAATNGWACHAENMTTPADTIKQTAYTTTTATFLATAAGGDAAVFQCTGF